MTPDDLLALFRQYVDEPDQTFVSDANAQSYLNQGYREFRQRVLQHNPSVYQTSTNITIGTVGPPAVSADNYDLSLLTNPVRLLGTSALTGPRLVMLLGVRQVDPTSGDTLRGLKGLPSRRSLGASPDGYFLDGSVLRFPEKVTGTFAIDYVPETGAIPYAAGAVEFDDMVDWHDLIVLYATKSYLIRDQGENPMLMNQMATRERDFAQFISERDVDAPSYVNEIYHTLDESW